MPKKRSGAGSYREAQLKKIAKQTGLSYTQKEEFGLINLLKDFRLFQKGIKKKIQNILRDKSNLYESDYQVFDYQYTMLNEETEQNYHQTVFFVQSKQLALPHFYIHPTTSFNEIGDYLGIEGIDSVGFRSFLGDYCLKGEGASQMRKNVSDELTSFLTFEKDWHIEGVNYYMVIYKEHKIVPTTELIAFYEKGRQIVNIFSL